MSIRPADLLDLAKALRASEPDESFQRGAASRAYYAALHAVDGTFERIERMDGESSHQCVIGSAVVYGKQSNPGRQQASQAAALLGHMRRERNRADYALDDDFSANDAQVMIERCEKVMDLCREVQSRKQAQLTQGSPP